MRAVRLLLLWFLVLLVLPRWGYGQSFTGEIAGTVRDASGAVLPQAVVRLTAAPTGATKTVLTAAQGRYRFMELPPAAYSIEVAHAGFKIVRRSIVLHVSQRLRADVVLQVGPPDEIVQVESVGGPAAVPTETHEISQVIRGEQLVELPTVTRNAYDLVFLAPLVNFDPGGRGATGEAPQGLISGGGPESGGSAINGMCSASNNFLLDGGENNDPFQAQVGQQVPLEAVHEFRLHLNNYSAEYGRNAGSIINVITRSGTNTLHGSLYEFYRGARLSAIDPEDKASQFRQGVRAPKRPAFVRHQFGFTAGGPLVRSRTFAFGALEGLRVRSTAPRSFFVPTPALLGAAASNMQEIFRAFPPPSSAGPFLTARDLVRLAPALRRADGPPLAAETPLFGLVNLPVPVDAGAGTPQNTEMGVAKIDHHFRAHTQLWGRYAWERQDLFPGSISLSPYAPFNTGSRAHHQNLALQMSHTLSPAWVTEGRFLYNRLWRQNPLGPAGVVPLFFFDFLNFDPRAPLALPGYQTKNFSTGLPSGGPQNIYQSFGTATWAGAKHLVKLGGQYVHLRDHRAFGAFQQATAVFQSLQSFIDGWVDGGYSIAVDPQGRIPGDGPRTPPSPSFPDGLTLLEGPFRPPSFTRHFRYNEVGLFVEDAFKPHPQWTVTLGLRWESFGGLHSPGHERALDSNLYLGPGDSLVERIRTARFRRVVDNPDGSGFSARPRGHWQPRVGFAWDPFGRGRTALRSGWGRFYDRNFGNAVFRVFQNPPAYAVITQLDPIRAGLDQYAALGSRFPLVTSARMLDEQLQTAQAHSWNVTLQQQFPGPTLVSFGYAGSNGIRLYSLNNLNRFGGCQFLPPSDPAHCIEQPRTRRRINNTGVTEFNRRSHEGLSRYHAGFIAVESAAIPQAGLWLGGNWTWSHALTNSSSMFGDSPFVGQFGFGFLDPFNPRRDYGSADFDSRHRVSLHWKWDLPGRPGAPAFARSWAYGWQLTGIVSVRTGFPFTLYNTGDPTFSYTSLPRAILDGAAPPVLGSAAPLGINTYRYIDLAAFSSRTNPDSGPYDPATIGSNTYRAPGIANWDLGIYKEFAVAETYKVQLRLELFNAWNHPNLFVDARTNNVRTQPAVTARFRGHRHAQLAVKLRW